MRILSKMKRLKEHPLLEMLSRNKGNPRTLVFIEPLWGIPYNLIAPFATLYMYTQGITDVQIGLILSISMFVQVFFSFFGGILTDKLGRKFTTMMGDFFGWAVACLIWAISNNFWLFLVAAILNSFEQINQTAWYCLLIEDAEPKDLIGLYTWVNIGGLVAIFFAPLSGLFINSFSVVPVLRILYLIFSINMILKTLITFRFCRETRQGKIRMAETKKKFRIPMWVGLALYAGAVLLLVLSPEGSLPCVVLYVFMWAVAAALINPRKDALLQLNINPQERARINALIMASTIALASPFGYFSGWLSSLDRRLPFIFMFLLFVAAMVIIGRIQEPEFDKNSGNADQRLDS